MSLARPVNEPGRCAFPNLQVILGHWGELVLFYLDRLVMLDRVSKLQRLDDAARQAHVDGYRAVLSALFEDRFDVSVARSDSVISVAGISALTRELTP
ncbi:hypothetical protein [Rhizobium leguminosarum]|uniref:hypothetical protein n=1 Tax=Rhizobium leguminosarum TaxID=384 RepID=UPI003F9A40E0